VRRPRRVRAPVAVSFGGVVAAGVVLLPMVYLVVRAGEGGWQGVSDTLLRARTLELTLRSLGMATVVTAASVVLGVTGAWFVTRTDLPARRLWYVLLCLPLAIPSYVAAWSWIGVRPGWAGPLGAAVVLTSVSYPYVLIPVAAALRRTDPQLEEAARSLGRPPWQVAIGVTLRQARVATVGGALLVALYALSDFGAVAIMRFESLTHVIYRSYRASYDRTPAAVLGCLLVAITLLVLFLQRRAVGNQRIAKLGAGTGRRAAPVRLAAWRWPAVAVVGGFLAVVLGVPAWSMAFWTRRGTSSADWSALGQATLTTAWVAALGAAATLLVALPVGVLSARYAGRLSKGVTSAAYAAHALPGIVVGLSLVFFGVRVATPLYQQMPLLVLAYVVLFLSLAIAAVHNSVAQSPPVLDEMSRTLGRSHLATWRDVTLRLAAPGLGAGALLVFLTVMKELPATLLLRPIGVDTLATRLWGHTESVSFAAAAPYAVAIVLLAAVPAAALTGRWTDGD